MTPTLILTIIATIAALRPFFEVPDSIAKSAALKRAGYRPSAKKGCAYLLLIPVLLGLWWWFALETDQILLGIIPTIGMVATVLGVTVENLAAKTTPAPRTPESADERGA